VSTVIVPAVNSIAMGNRRPVQFIAAIFVALGYHAQVGIRSVSDLIERRFAEFAGVPYQNPFSRQLWEELWESGTWLEVTTVPYYSMPPAHSKRFVIVTP
jgi:hypothetical protein